MPRGEADRPLAGLGVLITRPAHQAAQLARLFEQAGASVIRFPTLEIAPPADPATLDAVLARLPEFDLAVFVSANAVEQALARLRARGQSWPRGLATFGVGRATATALARHGIPAAAPEQHFDSEALLALPALQHVAGFEALILRGAGGRELLAETLAARGAQVSYAECYRRARPSADPAPLRARLARGEIHVVVITSSDGLCNLIDMLGPSGCAQLAHARIVVLSEAQAAVCRRRGLGSETLVAPEASDAAILETVKAWQRRRFSL